MSLHCGRAPVVLGKVGARHKTQRTLPLFAAGKIATNRAFHQNRISQECGLKLSRIMAPKRQQATLQAFFGTKQPIVKKSKGPTDPETRKSDTTTKKRDNGAKENTVNDKNPKAFTQKKTDKDKVVETEDEKTNETEHGEDIIGENKQPQNRRRKRRRIIDDDDEDETSNGSMTQDKLEKDEEMEDLQKSPEKTTFIEPTKVSPPSSEEKSTKGDSKVTNRNSQKSSSSSTASPTLEHDESEVPPSSEKSKSMDEDHSAADKSKQSKQKSNVQSMPSFFQPKSKSMVKEKACSGDSATKKKSLSSSDETPKPDEPSSSYKVEETTNQSKASSQEQTTPLPSPSELFKAAPKGQFLTDKKILGEIDTDQWPERTSVPYVVLCQVFAQIEEITGRLQIQEILTKLLRQILLRRANSDNDTTCRDLYDVLYLASNEVAPAYQCVELGIGDAILIKAIGEATGTSPNMVKSKYETVGDLGTVAMSCKSKQKTLGGFFGAAPSVKAKSKGSSMLTARTVLQVFREIAETKGNQAQKWKVDKIKKLLVKASVGIETKYIIRGLQGKLRIGLAQSTVLIALAHSLALTHVPRTATPSLEIKEQNTETGDEEEEADTSMKKKGQGKLLRFL